METENQQMRKWIEHLEHVVNQLYNAYLLETPVKEWPVGLYVSVTEITLEKNEEAMIEYEYCEKHSDQPVKMANGALLICVKCHSQTYGW